MQILESVALIVKLCPKPLLSRGINCQRLVLYSLLSLFILFSLVGEEFLIGVSIVEG